MPTTFAAAQEAAMTNAENKHLKPDELEALKRARKTIAAATADVKKGRVRISQIQAEVDQETENWSRGKSKRTSMPPRCGTRPTRKPGTRRRIREKGESQPASEPHSSSTDAQGTLERPGPRKTTPSSRRPLPAPRT